MHRTLTTLVASAIVLAVLAPAADAAGPASLPPITWLKGEGNYTKSHRPYGAIDRVVVHVTEGSFWGSVRWLRSPRAHASSHFVVSRRGKIIQLVHVSDIAWHAGHWRTNARSVGIEHEGRTYGPGGFTTAQYEASARLTAYVVRRALMPIDRAHIIGHHVVPAPGGGRGGASHHTDPGPRWSWGRYLQLVRRFALGGVKLRVEARLRAGPLLGIVPWHAATAGGVRRVEFVVDGRVLWTDRRAPFSFGGGRGLNTLALANGRHVLELRAYGDGTRHDVTRRTVVVGNRDFALTTAGARQWGRVRGVVQLRVRARGAKAAAVVLRVDGDRVAADRRAPYVFRWDSRRSRDGKHVLSLAASSIDGRVAQRRIVVVTSNRPQPAARPKPKPTPTALRITGQSLADGQTVTGFVLWRADVGGAASSVQFLVDGELRGTDVQRPFTLGWDTAAEQPGPHRLVVRAIARDGRSAERAITVTVASPPA
jgi:hypothetical protein